MQFKPGARHSHSLEYGHGNFLYAFEMNGNSYTMQLKELEGFNLEG